MYGRGDAVNAESGRGEPEDEAKEADWLFSRPAFCGILYMKQNLADHYARVFI
jgi:hypothetical protein